MWRCVKESGTTSGLVQGFHVQYTPAPCVCTARGGGRACRRRWQWHPLNGELFELSVRAGRPPTPAPVMFPQGDTLGVVLSFLSARELVQGGLFRVSQEWRRVLCTLPHAWGLSLDLGWTRGRITSWCTFAWHRIRVSREPAR